MKLYTLRRWLAMAVLCLGVNGLLAQLSVNGNVKDTNEENLVGVSIQLKGSTSGTVTDIDGNFSIEIPDNSGVLIFSYTGYQITEVEVSSANASNLQIVMEDDFARIDEVVITGLATNIKRSNLANNVSTVSTELLNGTTTGATLDGALYGKMTGVFINSAGGAPGGQTAMRLRGISSLSGNNQPLIILDGVYISNVQLTNGSAVASGANAGREEGGSNRIGDINPDDIESIEVLKGASAAAIYGTRANAGVIIITTKRGSAGKTKISFDQDVGVNTIQNFVGRRQFTPSLVESIYGSSERQIFEAAQARGEIFDYEKELYGEEGLILDSRLSISGGKDKTQFYFNLSRRDEDGIMKFTGFERNSVRLNLDHKISDRLKVGISSNFVKSKLLLFFNVCFITNHTRCILQNNDQNNIFAV